jgi:hypothetical protein
MKKKNDIERIAIVISELGKVNSLLDLHGFGELTARVELVRNGASIETPGMAGADWQNMMTSLNSDAYDRLISLAKSYKTNLENELEELNGRVR